MRRRSRWSQWAWGRDREPAGVSARRVLFMRMAMGVATAGLIYLVSPSAASAAPGMAAADTHTTALVTSAPASDEPFQAGAPVSFMGSTIEHPLTRLRELYYAAVEDRVAIAAAMEEIEALRDAGLARSGSRRAAVLDAYVGALTTLRAKHGRWPPDRLRHLNDGLHLLDEAVADAPDVAEIRYLRLMSCYYLPGILGRGSTVREDFAALKRLLPDAAGEFPPELYRVIVSFVVENGEPGPEERAMLEAAADLSHTGTE